MIVLPINPQQFADPDDEPMRPNNEPYKPHVFVFSSGESTPYEIRVRRGVNGPQLAMRGDVFGEIEFVDEDE